MKKKSANRTAPKPRQRAAPAATTSSDPDAYFQSDTFSRMAAAYGMSPDEYRAYLVALSHPPSAPQLKPGILEEAAASAFDEVNEQAADVELDDLDFLCVYATGDWDVSDSPLVARNLISYARVRHYASKESLHKELELGVARVARDRAPRRGDD
jgi:hypothetical protein